MPPPADEPPSSTKAASEQEGGGADAALDAPLVYAADSPLAQAVTVWLEALLAASRPELSWTPASLNAALEWAQVVEDGWADEATRAEVEACVAAAAAGCVSPPPPPAAARVSLLQLLLRSLRLWHGDALSPLLEGGPESVAPTLAALLAPEDGGSALQALQAEGACSGCAARPPHAPALHLRQARVAAAAARASAQCAQPASGPPSPVAAALCLAVRGCGSDGASFPAEEAASAAAAAALLPLLAPTRTGGHPPWAALPPWLAALTCAGSEALCGAHAAALLRSRPMGQAAVCNAAARLRLLGATGAAAAAAVERAVEAAGAIAAVHWQKSDGEREAEPL